MITDLSSRYELAAQIHKGRLALNDRVFPHWIVDSPCFWYRRAIKEGTAFRLVDPGDASNKAAFDHGALATALAKASGESIKPQNLPLKEVTITLSPLKVRFMALGKHWEFEPDGAGLGEIKDVNEGRRSPFSNNSMFIPLILPAEQQTLDAPDGKTTAFVRSHNLWVRDLATGKERALTEDGTHDYGYSPNRSLGIDTAVHAQWSPDSKRLFAVRRDARKLEPRVVIHYVPKSGGLRPQPQTLKQPRAHDDHTEMYELSVIEVETGQQQLVDYPAVPLIRVGVLVVGLFRAKLGWWASDSRHAFFVHASRGAKSVRVVRWDTHTGAAKVLFEETSDTFVKLTHDMHDPFQLLPLPDSNELIWFSERSGWAHLYLYDLTTGKLKSTITSGEWLVRDVVHFDAKRRELLFQTGGREPGVNPYYRDVCKVNVDTGALTPLAAGNFEHSVYPYWHVAVISAVMMGEESGEVHAISPDGQYLVVTRSRVDSVPVTVLIDREGREVLEIETADVSALPKDFVWPEPVALKGADGKTDIYGVVYRPPGFSPDKSYPVVEYAHTTRGYCGFSRCSFQDDLLFSMGGAIAALGFIVVAVDGRGAPLRSKAFADYHYGDPYYTSAFDDRIAGMRQLAERYPCIDMERVGITGPEEPTNAIYALLRHSDVYKVAVQHCPTDPRFVPAMEEHYNGTVDKAVLNGPIYPEHYVDTFDGKQLLIVGMISHTATDSSFRFVEALQKANKDFDMVALPNLHHEMSSYTTRREWDYLVKNLLGIEPPKGFQMKTAYDEAADAFGDAGALDVVDYS